MPRHPPCALAFLTGNIYSYLILLGSIYNDFWFFKNHRILILLYIEKQITYFNLTKLILKFLLGKSQRTDFLLLERRWSSRTFRYGYLVTTSPQLLTLPSTAASNWFAHRLRVLPTPMVWRAVCTRPGNAFTATFWFAITSNSNFMYSSCRVQSELGQTLWVSLQIALSLPSVSAIVARV